MATTFVQLKMCKVDLRNYIDEKLRNNLEVDLIILNSYRKVIEQIKSAECQLLVKNTKTKSAFHHPPPKPSVLTAGGLFLQKVREKARKKGKVETMDLKNEIYRVYTWIDPVTKNEIVHRIEEPVLLCVGTSTHRVTDSKNVVHCVPSVGYFGCVITWENVKVKLSRKIEPVDDVPDGFEEEKD